jgi:hypothetical protein
VRRPILGGGRVAIHKTAIHEGWPTGNADGENRDERTDERTHVPHHNVSCLRPIVPLQYPGRREQGPADAEHQVLAP